MPATDASRRHEIWTFTCGDTLIAEIQLVGLEQKSYTLELCPLHEQSPIVLLEMVDQLLLDGGYSQAVQDLIDLAEAIDGFRS